MVGIREYKRDMTSQTASGITVKKRERTQNWVQEEKSALFLLIKMNVEAVENKKIDAAASAMKTLAWKEIHSGFRGRFSTERDITRMREQWRRMKAQARIEMYTFAEKVRTLGPEEASKSRPSDLSIEVWRLMETSRGQDVDVEISDGSSQDLRDEGMVGNFQSMINKLVESSTPEITIHEIKIENGKDDCNEGNRRGEGANRKRAKMDEIFLGYLHPGESGDSSDNVPKLRTEDQFEPRKNNMVWIFETAEKEHILKLKMLNIELKRADLQKQSAVNDLKTSELKEELIRGQIAEFYR